MAILNCFNEGAVLLNKEMKVFAINKKALHLLSISYSESVSRSFDKLVVKNLLLSQCQLLLKKYKEKNQFQSLLFYFDEEKKKYRDITISEVEETGLIILLIKDSSSEYKIQQVGKDFVSNASHELRTPITIIKGFAETINDLPEISSAMLEDFTGKIIRNCQRMDKLVKNLLTLADLDYQPKSRIQECDLVALVDNCVYTLLAVHPTINIETLQNKDVILVSANPDLLELAIMNLLENAVKYSPTPAFITITLEEIEGGINLYIADKGMGIPAQDIEHIFERFYTVNKAHSRRLGGAGLGLSIVKTIINNHDGRIAVTSKLGMGTEFKISFEKQVHVAIV